MLLYDAPEGSDGRRGTGCPPVSRGTPASQGNRVLILNDVPAPLSEVRAGRIAPEIGSTTGKTRAFRGKVPE